MQYISLHLPCRMFMENFGLAGRLEMDASIWLEMKYIQYEQTRGLHNINPTHNIHEHAMNTTAYVTRHVKSGIKSHRCIGYLYISVHFVGSYIMGIGGEKKHHWIDV